MLTNLEQDFVNLFTNGASLTYAQAYKRAFDEPSMDDKKAHKCGRQLSKRKYVAKAIKKQRKQIAKATRTSAENVITKLLEIYDDASSVDVFDKEGNLTGSKRDHRVQIETLKEINKMVGNYTAIKHQVEGVVTSFNITIPTSTASIIDVEAIPNTGDDK